VKNTGNGTLTAKRNHYTMFRYRLPPIFQLATVSTRVNSI
jgi:hypothetical protein